MKKVKLFEDYIKEAKTNTFDFKFKGKKYKMDLATVEIEDIDMRDYPDFSDAFIAYAEDEKGNPLSDEVIDHINDEYYYLASEMIHDDQLYL